MVIQLNEYRKARALKRAAPALREEEPLCVNWNPAFSVIALSCYQRPQELSPELPEDYVALESAFLDRVHALASQI